MLVELGQCQMPVRIRTPNRFEQPRLIPIIGGAHRDDLLSQDVEWCFRNDQPVELAAPDREHECRALDELVTRGREQPALGYRAAPVPGPPDALQSDGDRTWRSHLAHEVDRADVDSKLERRGGDKHSELAGFQTAFGLESDLPRQASVMGRHDVCADALGQVERDALGQPPRVDEHER